MSFDDARRRRAEHARAETRRQTIRRAGRYAIFGVIALLGVATVAGAVIGLREVGGGDTPASGGEARENTPAPDFELPATTGRAIRLSEYENRSAVLLYFFEGLMCGPCWDQVEDIQEEYVAFQGMDMEVLSITVDPMNALIKESQRRGLTLPILDDMDLRVSTDYGMLNNSMHPDSRPGHSFALIDRDGNWVWTRHYYFVDHVMGGMAMGTDDSRMYVPIDELLRDIREASTLLSADPASPTATGSGVDHTMCQTPIHYHSNFKLYFNDRLFNLSQRDYMDQHMDAHFHPTVKVKPEDTPGIPVSEIVHVHKPNLTLQFFLSTLDFDDNTRGLLADPTNLRVYVNGTLRSEGLNATFEEASRILVTYGNLTKDQVDRQQASVTSYTTQDKEKYPHLFGGC